MSINYDLFAKRSKVRLHAWDRSYQLFSWLTLKKLPQKSVVKIAGQVGDVECAARGVCCRVGCTGWFEVSSCHALLLKLRSAQSGQPSELLGNRPHHSPVAGSMKSPYFIGGVESEPAEPCKQPARAVREADAKRSRSE